MNPPGKTRGATEAEGKSLSLRCLQTTPEENTAGTMIESEAGYSRGQRGGGREREIKRERGRETGVLPRGIKKFPTTPDSNLHNGGTSGQFPFALGVCSVDGNTELRPALLRREGQHQKGK